MGKERRIKDSGKNEECVLTGEGTKDRVKEEGIKG